MSAASNPRNRNGFSSNSYDYKIFVRTGDRPEVGKHVHVSADFILRGNRLKSRVLKLDVRFTDEFVRGQLNTFVLKSQKISDVDSIEIIPASDGISDDWFVDTIKVRNDTTQTEFVFPVFRRIRTDRQNVFIPIDTSLPHLETRLTLRKDDLEEAKKKYQLEQKAPGLPPQVKDLPREERFSISHLFDIDVLAAKLIFESGLVRLLTGRWETIDDIKNVYTFRHFTEPENTQRWEDDVEFGRQRIAGVNNSFIKLCSEIPDKLGVTNEMIEPFLEGLSVLDALRAKRIFIVDYEILKNCPTAKGVVTAAPIALFYQKNDGNLIPIAIQLLQDKAENNPVFSPSDPKFTWIMAKMWFNNADTGIHESIVHLGFTHLVMEGIAVITHRNLSQSHPLFKLLSPHFLYIMAINDFALKKLVNPGGWVDTAMSVAVEGMFELIRRQKPNWRMNVEGTLPADLKARGVDDLNILPGYYFRDDALLLYSCIRAYVVKYVTLYFENDNVILLDDELQNWRAEMVKPCDDGGLGVPGVAGVDGKFTTSDQVVEVLTSVIYTCSVAHAAVNFKQYDEYAFPPNYPSKLAGPLQNSKTTLWEDDILDCLPDKKTTLDVMVITKVLSMHDTNPLGDFEVDYIVDPDAIEIVNEFKTDLEKISKTIAERNLNRDPQYKYLDPAGIPNAISI